MTEHTAILRYSKDRKSLLVLCPIGHLVDHYTLDESFGGSWLEAQIGAHQSGEETSWDRRAKNCQGAGH